MFTFQKALFAALCLSSLAGAQAGDIYRWVDEQGRTHLSDVVPKQYKDTATRIDSTTYELTPEQQRDAAARAARERERSPEMPESRSTSASPQTTPSAPAPSGLVLRPDQAVTASTACKTRWRLFRESEACFGRFNVVGGGIKPEAFEQCQEIPSPLLECGPETN